MIKIPFSDVPDVNPATNHNFRNSSFRFEAVMDNMKGAAFKYRKINYGFHIGQRCLSISRIGRGL